MVRHCEILALVLCTACATTGGPRVTTDDLQLVDSLFSAYSGSAAPGASVVVIADGRVVVRRAYGMADLEQHLAATPETDYRLASVSKQFTAMAVMLLADDRKLRYDQPVRDFLPELPVAAQPVTVRHLLNHTSGLWDYEDLIPDSRTAQLDDRDVLTLLASKDSLYFPAGSQYRYSNSGYVLLGLIVARVSGMSFPEFLRTRIFEPLGMRATVAHVEGWDTVPRARRCRDAGAGHDTAAIARRRRHAVRIWLVRRSPSGREALAPYRRDERLSECDPAVPGPAPDGHRADQSLQWRTGRDRRAHRRPTVVSLALDPVPEGPDGDDVARMGGVALQLAPQHGDVRIYGPAHHVLRVAPHLPE